MHIKCIWVIGRGGYILENPEGHAWNYVKLESKWYAIDATWDDAVKAKNKGDGYKYFLMGSKQTMKSHIQTEKYEYPELAGDKRDKVCIKL